MICEVVMFSDLSRPLESGLYEILDMTINEFLAAEIKNYDSNKHNFFTVTVDGVKIPSDLWKHFNLKSAKSIKIIIEPMGDPFTWVAIIVTIAAAVYSAYLMHKLTATTGQQDTKTGSSIYDVNAQGNKVKLNQVIPEQFGLIKRFPDYVADTHRFYRNNQRVLDISLCQGVGQFSRSASGNDIYFGSTPFNQMSEKIQYKVFEPSENLADNSISSELGWCWFNSTEITASGKELKTPKSRTNEDELVYLFTHSLAVMNYETREFKSKNWEVGDILKIQFPKKHVLFGDNFEYRRGEWAFQHDPIPTNYVTELKGSLDLQSNSGRYWLKGGHGSNFNLITLQEYEDPEHDRYSLISGNHYNHSGLDEFSYYDKNEFCKCWGEGYVISDSYAHFHDFIEFENTAFPESIWADSAICAAVIGQVIDEDKNITKAVYQDTWKGINYMAVPWGTYGTFLNGHVTNQGRIAVWDIAPGYSSPGNWSQFWNRDDSDCYDGQRIIDFVSSVKSGNNFSEYGKYTKVGLTWDDYMSMPYTYSPYSYQDFEVSSPAYFYYCFSTVNYTIDDERLTEFYRIVGVKQLDSVQPYYLGWNFWGGYSPQNQKVYLFRVKKCDSEGNIDQNWKCFKHSWDVEKGGDYEEDGEQFEGINITVFDHVES